jgi:hypothetical protein
MARTNTNLEGFSWLYGADPALGQHASVKESVARRIGEFIAKPVRQFDEAKSLFRAEPFNNSTDSRAGRCLEPGLAEARSGAESTRLRVVGISVEIATPRITKILMSQFWFLEGDARLARDSEARRPLAVTDGIDGDAKRVARVSAH